MTRFIRLSVLAAATAALVACGGSGAKLGGGKEGAAQAMFEATQPAANSGKNQQDLLARLASAATGEIEVSVDCAQGGSVKLKLDVTSIGGQSGAIKYDLSYDSCSEDGVNEYDGTLTMELKIGFDINGGTASGKMTMKLKGKLDLKGDIDDFLDADITQTIELTATEASGQVTVQLDGYIKTSSGNYTYAKESITITAGGELPTDDGNS